MLRLRGLVELLKTVLARRMRLEDFGDSSSSSIESSESVDADFWRGGVTRASKLIGA